MNATSRLSSRALVNWIIPGRISAVSRLVSRSTVRPCDIDAAGPAPQWAWPCTPPWTWPHADPTPSGRGLMQYPPQPPPPPPSGLGITHTPWAWPHADPLPSGRGLTQAPPNQWAWPHAGPAPQWAWLSGTHPSVATDPDPSAAAGVARERAGTPSRRRPAPVAPPGVSLQNRRQTNQ